jgi:hypothetical protein
MKPWYSTITRKGIWAVFWGHWMPIIFQIGGERQCRMKSFRFGGVSLFDTVSALGSQELSSHPVPTSQTGRAWDALLQHIVSLTTGVHCLALQPNQQYWIKVCPFGWSLPRPLNENHILRCYHALRTLLGSYMITLFLTQTCRLRIERGKYSKTGEDQSVELPNLSF